MASWREDWGGLLAAACGIKSLLKPYPEELMDAHDVSPIVNSAKYDGPECIEPVSDDDIPSTRQLSLLYATLKSVAVGTALTSGPPHRSVREELPHTALTSGSCDGQPLVGIRLVVRATPPVSRIPGSVSGASALVVRSPWSPSFPLRTPLPTHTRRLCSPASLVL